MKHTKFMLLAACVLLSAGLCAETINGEFGKDPQNLTGNFQPTYVTKNMMGKNLSVTMEKGFVRLKTIQANMAFSSKKMMKNGEYTFKYKDYWKASIYLYAHCDNACYNGYSVNYDRTKNKISLGRRLGGKYTLLKSVDQKIDSSVIELGLVFDGKTITVKAQGTPVISVPDDGKNHTGFFGFGGCYYTTIDLIGFTAKENEASK